VRFNLVLIAFVFFSFLSLGTETKYKKGLDELKKKEFRQAEMFFLEVTQEAPSFVSFYNLGVVSGELENWAKAKWAFESALKYNPSNGDAQYNAKFVSDKLNGNQNWTHPYPWSERIIVSFGIYTWLTLVLVSATFLGFSIFLFLTKKNEKTTLVKWTKRLVLPVSLVFLISFYGTLNYTHHFTAHQFAVFKSDNAKLYISPNGIELSDQEVSRDRVEVIEYFEDSTWVQIRTSDNLFWVKTKDLFVY